MATKFYVFGGEGWETVVNGLNQTLDTGIVNVIHEVVPPIIEEKINNIVLTGYTGVITHGNKTQTFKNGLLISYT